MITSSGNSQIRYVKEIKKKAKERDKAQLFLVEGIRMFLETPKERLWKVYISESFEKKYAGDARVAKKLEHISCETVSDQVFETMSDTKTPQGVIALVRQFSYEMKDLTGDGRRTPLLVVLEDLQDPGNLGTVMRTAEGAGATGVVMSDGCVDIYNPKVIRSTMGSIYRVPFLYTEDLCGTIAAWKEQGIRTYAAHLGGERSYENVDWNGPAALLIGNEARGLSDETAGMADEKILIPMLGKVESLNAAVAASVILFEAARVRRSSQAG